jgi:hypothetical protein
MKGEFLAMKIYNYVNDCAGSHLDETLLPRETMPEEMKANAEDQLFGKIYEQQTGVSAGKTRRRVYSSNGEKRTGFRGFSRRMVLLAASLALVLGLTVTAYATGLFGFGEVAQMVDPTAASTFRTDSAVEIGESQVSGGYEVTLLGMAKGGELATEGFEGDEIAASHTYLAAAVAKEDGSAVSADAQFFVLPMISGQKPWQTTFSDYGQASVVKDGVYYTLIDVENLEIFADRTVYLSVMDSPFYDHSKFVYDDVDGTIAVSPEYGGVVTLFELPLDKSLADPAKAAEIIAQNTAPVSEAGEDEPTGFESYGDAIVSEDDIPGPDYILIDDSVKELTVKADGTSYYEYAPQDGFTIFHRIINLPAKKYNKAGYSPETYMSYEVDGEMKTVCLMVRKAEDGKLYGEVYKVPNLEFFAVEE